MFEIKEVLTNVRPKNEEAVLIAAPTKGILKVSAIAARRLGITAGDYVSVLTANTDNGLAPFVFKGSPKNEETGANQVGSKCDFSNNANGGSLQFSSGNVWKTLDGDVNSNTKYSVAETPVSQNGVDYYQLTFVGKTAKTIKEKSSNGAAEVAHVNDMGAMVSDED